MARPRICGALGLPTFRLLTTFGPRPMPFECQDHCSEHNLPNRGTIYADRVPQVGHDAIADQDRLVPARMGFRPVRGLERLGPVIQQRRTQDVPVENCMEARQGRPAMTANVVAFILGIVAPVGVVGWVLFFH